MGQTVDWPSATSGHTRQRARRPTPYDPPSEVVQTRHMNPVEGLALLLAGIAAGTINTIVGSGSLITFPTLLALGYPPIVANVSNTVGLVPGGMSGVLGYRRELVGQRRRVFQLGVPASIGGLCGGLALLT